MSKEVLPENLIQLTAIEPRRVAQSIAELEFALSLVPCGTCGAYEINRRKYKASWYPNRSTAPHVRFGVECHCPECGQRRQLISWAVQDPPNGVDLYHVTAHGPSEIIEPWQLMEEMDRLAPAIPSDPTVLSYHTWPRGGHLTRALTCATELHKFIVADAREILATEYTARGRAHRTAQRSRYLATTCAETLRALTALKAAYVAEVPRIDAEYLALHGPPKEPVGALNSTTIRAHEAWLRRGRQGAGQLVLKHQSFDDINLPLMGGAELENLQFLKASAYAVPMTGIHMTDVTFDQSYLQAVNFTGARLHQVVVRNSNANVIRFTDAHVTQCHFENTELAITRWTHAVTEKTTFVNCLLTDARFADATFRHCDFQGNFMGTGGYAECATSAGARFEDCDLRCTGWEGRDLSGATFVRCKFAGSGGVPRAHANLVLQDCDMSADEFLAMLAAWEEARRARAEAAAQEEKP